MCPKGHSLLVKSESFAGRWRWAAHARRCAACAEVRVAARFVEAFAARAGRWPAAGAVTRGVPRRWQWAAAAAVVAVLLPLGLSALWVERPRGRAPAAAVTEEARSIRTVHYTGKKLLGDVWYPLDVKIKYPDKIRDESQGAARIANGDIELIVFDQPTTHPDNPAPYRYVLMAAEEAISPAARFTEAGVRTRWDDPAAPVDVQQSEEVADNGDTIIVVEGRRKDYPDTSFVERTRIDPVSHRVKSWDHEQHYLTKGGEPGVFRMIVDQIEYNVDFPEGTFDTTVPAGENFLDLYSPKALAASYRRALDEVESLPRDQQGTLIQEYRDNVAFNHLDRLAPDDRREIETRLRRVGILDQEDATRRERDGASDAQARLDRRRAELAQAAQELARDRADLEKALREAQPKPDEAAARAQAVLAQARLEEARARAARALNELQARRRVLPEIEAARQRAEAQLRQSEANLDKARAAAKKGDERAQEARKRLEASEAALRAQLKALAATRAAMEQQLQQAEQRRAEAEKALAAAQARIEEAQRALAAAREGNKGDQARVDQVRRAPKAAREANKRK